MLAYCAAWQQKGFSPVVLGGCHRICTCASSLPSGLEPESIKPLSLLGPASRAIRLSKNLVPPLPSSVLRRGGRDGIATVIGIRVMATVWAESWEAFDRCVLRSEKRFD
jgi:hypothetical protein